MKQLFSIVCLSGFVCMLSCGLHSDDTSKENDGPLSFTERLNERNGYKQDAQGNWVPMSDKRSSFESQGQFSHFTGQQSKKEFNTGSYDKKRFNRQGFITKNYDHGKDGSRFSKESSLSGNTARESSQAHAGIGTYQTNLIDRSSAYESGRSSIEKTTDYQTERRRDVYVPPTVIDYKQQRQMTVDQSKGILGRLRGE